MPTIRVRSERPADAPAIDAVTIAAFRSATHSSGTEQFIVGALRRSGQLRVSLVAEMRGRIVGRVAASPVTMLDGPADWNALGPVWRLEWFATLTILSLVVLRLSMQAIR